MKRILIVAGILLIIASAGWKFFISPQANQRFPDGWTWEVNTLGKTSYADETTGQFPEGTTLADDPVNLTQRTVTAKAAGSDQVTISDNFVTRDPVTNEVLWEYTSTAVVDPVTGKQTQGDLAGDYYFIPQHAEKTTYTISNSSYVSLPTVFQQEETVAGINTYKYAFYGDLPNTLSYEGYIELEEGQEVICFDFQLEYWVEPTTGEIVKYREACEGDYVVDSATGERLYGLQRWGGESTGDDLIRQADVVQSRLNDYRWKTLYIPLLLVLAGAILLVIAFVPGLLPTSNEPKKVVV